MLGLVGPNGSGKSTLLALLAGLYSPTSGELEVRGYRSPRDERELRRIVGLVVQDADLQLLGATVAEDLLLGQETSPEKLDLAHRLAESFALEGLWDEPVQTLSWGQKKKLSICGILMSEPEVMLLDEPFAGLDYPGALEMRQILVDNRKAGLTQVVAVHDLEPIADLADTWAVLGNGQIVALGVADEVFPSLASLGVRPPCSWQVGLGIQPWDWSL